MGPEGRAARLSGRRSPARQALGVVSVHRLARCRWGLVAVGLVALVVGFLGGFALARLSEGDGEVAGADCPLPEAAQTPADQSSLPARLAPLVFLHPGERFRPMAAECFLAQSELRWARPAGSDPLVAKGEVDTAKLGSGEYRMTSVGGTCGQAECEFTSRDFTRPYDERRSGTLARRGFFLDVEDSFRSGARSTSEGPIFTGTPAYYEFVEGRFVTYWFFYGFSAPGALVIQGGIRKAAHEGDWERISIRLELGNVPAELAYYAHGGEPSIMAWSLVPKLGSHPVVFSGQGSHASYSRAGRFDANFDVTKVGLLWPTWDALENVREQPWYGFGGAWGVAREDAELAGPLASPSELTGPLGPSAYKRPAPCAWTGECP